LGQTRRAPKLNSTPELLLYADDINILGGSMHAIVKHTKAFVVASKEIGLELNAKKTKYMTIPRDKYARQNHKVNLGDMSFEMLERFRYLGTTLTKQNSIHEDVKNIIKSANVWYNSAQNPLPSSLLSENINVKIYRTVLLPVVLYGCEAWSLMMREEHWLKLFFEIVYSLHFNPAYIFS
jgi:hypothetical protein